MGGQKLLLPWADTTVLGQVVQTLRNAGVEDIIIITNSEVANSISNLQCPVILNDGGEMLASIQCGLRAVKPSAEAALICLGDQPQMEEGSVQRVCEAFEKTGSHLVVPSYQMKRGHPWLAARPIWDGILALQEGQSMRGFMNAHSDEIHYVNLDTPTILQDLDTPDDYLKYKPGL